MTLDTYREEINTLCEHMGLKVIETKIIKQYDLRPFIYSVKLVSNISFNSDDLIVRYIKEGYPEDEMSDAVFFGDSLELAYEELFAIILNCQKLIVCRPNNVCSNVVCLCAKPEIYTMKKCNSIDELLIWLSVSSGV